MSIINSEENKAKRGSAPCTTEDNFWDLIFLTRGGGIFRSSEKTYMKIVPGGWLMRHVFFKGKRFTSSDIIFFPDANAVWNDCKFDVHWEHINTKSTPNFKFIMHRLKAPQGWVVKEFLTTKSRSSNEGMAELNLTYIPDPEHKWVA